MTKDEKRRKALLEKMRSQHKGSYDIASFFIAASSNRMIKWACEDLNVKINTL